MAQNDIDKLRKSTPAQIAKELVSVQDMSSAHRAIAEMYEQGKTEKELAQEGYQPISNDTRLMWVKK